MSEVESGQPAAQPQQDPNHKVFSSQIEDEVAGINERGVRAPQVNKYFDFCVKSRIKVKFHLLIQTSQLNLD